MQEVFPGLLVRTMAAQQVAGYGIQQVVATHVRDVEQRLHDLQACLRAECLSGRDPAVELNDWRRADPREAVIQRGDPSQSVSSATVARAWQAAIAAWRA